jgi:hypothetical protein
MNPYPGLRPFDELDHEVFFGREEEVDDLVKRLSERRLVAVLGISGCGKSSLVRAGLIPLLRSGLSDPLGGDWRIIKIFPGTAPLEELQRALETKLENRSHALRDWARRQPPGTRVLLFVDQFEEIFTYREETLATDGGNAAALFIDLLLTAIKDPGGPLYGVLTMRTDYLGKTAFFRGLAEALNNGHYLVPRLTRLQLQDAIELPAKSRGVVPAPALVQRLLNDSEDDPDKLPVLQHLLKRLWEERAGGPLDLALCERVGGWNGALEKDVEAVLGQFVEERDGVRRIFQWLTDPGIGDTPARRRRPVSELAAIAHLTPARVDAILEAFESRDFLRGEGSGSAAMVELMHESVMWQWPRLKRWIQEEAAEGARLRFYREAARKKLKLTGSTLL